MVMKLPDITKGVLGAGVHISRTGCEPGRQEDYLAEILYIGIMTQRILQMNKALCPKLPLVIPDEQQPLPFNLGVHVCQKLIEELPKLVELIVVTLSDH